LVALADSAGRIGKWKMIPKPKPTKQPKGKKKRPPSERKILVKQLDDLVSLIVRKRDGQCVTPGNCYGFLTCSHYYKRENWGLRWNLENCNCQCSAHNRAHNYHEYAYSEYMCKHYGRDVFSELLAYERAYRAGPKWTIPQMIDLLAELKEVYDGLGTN
jgi:hypothetical protein